MGLLRRIHHVAQTTKGNFMFTTVNAPTKQQWQCVVLQAYPRAVIASDGTRVWAQVPGIGDVGYWSIIGNSGMIAPRTASCRGQSC